MKQGRTDRDWAVVAVMTFLVGVVVTWAVLGKHPPQPRPPIEIDWPAWVQAVGSVGAILGAIGIAAYERSVARKETAERERRENDARFTRGNRAVMRFRKTMAPHLAFDRDMPRSHVMHPVERLAVPDAMLELEHDCHLMGDAGAACLNAIRCFENAQDLISHSMLRGMNAKKFFEQMDLADGYCEQASKHFVKYLVVASK